MSEQLKNQIMVEESSVEVISGVRKDDETEILIDCLLNDKALPEEKSVRKRQDSIEEISGNMLAFLKENPGMSKSM